MDGWMAGDAGIKTTSASIKSNLLELASIKPKLDNMGLRKLDCADDYPRN